MILPKGSELPPAGGARRTPHYQYLLEYWPQLEVGDVLLVPFEKVDNYESARSSAYTLARKNGQQASCRWTREGMYVQRVK